jgi:hypothetical protein
MRERGGSRSRADARLPLIQSGTLNSIHPPVDAVADLDEVAERLFATSDEGLIRDARCARPIWYYRARSEPSPCSRVAYSSILTAVPRRSVHT